MTILRDISFLWAMFHVPVLFLLLFEPRYRWRTTLLAGFTGTGVLIVANVLLMAWKGPSIIMRVAIFTCTIPSALLFFILHRFCFLILWATLSRAGQTSALLNFL